MTNNKKFLLRGLLCIALGLLLTACGGGGGGTVTDTSASTGGGGTTATSGGGGGGGGGGTSGSTSTGGGGTDNGSGSGGGGGVSAASGGVDKDIVVTPVADTRNMGPQIARLANGGFVAVWNRSKNGYAVDASDAVLAQVYDAQANAVGGPVTLYAAGAQSRLALDPHVAGLADGRFAVTFISRLGSVIVGNPYDYRLHVAVWNTNGVGAAAETPLANWTYNDVVALGDGTYAVAFDSRATGQADGGLAVQHYRDLTPLGAATVLATSTIGYGYPWTTSTPDGGFAVAWTGFNTTDGVTGVGDTANIRLQRFAPDGSPTGSAATVMLGVDSRTSSLASIAALKSGDFVFGLHNLESSTRSSDGGWYAEFAIVHPDGSIAVPRTRVDDETELAPFVCTPRPVPCYAPDQRVDTVAALDDGSFALVWHSGAHLNQLLVKRYGAGGDALSAINAVASGGQPGIADARATAFGGNGLALVFQQAPSGTTATGVSGHVWAPVTLLQ